MVEEALEAEWKRKRKERIDGMFFSFVVLFTLGWILIAGWYIRNAMWLFLFLGQPWGIVTSIFVWDGVGNLEGLGIVCILFLANSIFSHRQIQKTVLEGVMIALTSAIAANLIWWLSVVLPFFGWTLLHRIPLLFGAFILTSPINSSGESGIIAGLFGFVTVVAFEDASIWWSLRQRAMPSMTRSCKSIGSYVSLISGLLSLVLYMLYMTPLRVLIGGKLGDTNYLVHISGFCIAALLALILRLREPILKVQDTPPP